MITVVVVVSKPQLRLLAPLTASVGVNLPSQAAASQALSPPSTSSPTAVAALDPLEEEEDGVLRVGSISDQSIAAGSTRAGPSQLATNLLCWGVI